MIIQKVQLDDFQGIFDLYKKVAAQGNGIAREANEITEGYIKQNLTQGLNDSIVLIVEAERQIVAEIHAYPMALFMTIFLLDG